IEVHGLVGDFRAPDVGRGFDQHVSIIRRSVAGMLLPGKMPEGNGRLRGGPRRASLAPRNADIRRRRDRGSGRQPTFRTAAARPIKTDPMINNFAASGTGTDHNGAAPAPVDRETTMDDATAVDADVAGAA